MCKNTRVLLMNTLSTFFCTVLGMVEKDVGSVSCNKQTICCASKCLTFWVGGKDVCIYKEVPVDSFWLTFKIQNDQTLTVKHVNLQLN